MEEEESELIFLDLSELSGTVSLAGAKISVQGLDTKSPVLELPDGTIMDGTHQESIGTQLFVESFPQTKPAEEQAARSPNLLGMSSRIVKFSNRAPKKDAAAKRDPMARFQMSKMVQAPVVKKRKVSQSGK